jgi:peptidyl-prolyl cis-trans isomerase A (cyclophilin A)
MSMQSTFAAAVLMACAATVTVAGQADLARAARLRNPAALNETAPATYRARFETSKGAFVIEVTREWAPIGADRFYNLVKNGFYDDQRFFRVIPGFMVQWGMNGNPVVTKAWDSARLQDDPVKQSNRAGYISFAAESRPNTRGTQVFINFVDNVRLDKIGFAPFGRVVEGMDVVLKINAQHREEPDQALIESQGNAYLNRVFPALDFIKAATITK